ncbi:unnamed protein product [Candidula unifasciata]|uniref:ATP-grasp domain-containing protein n=1 Tax=Candidula unifasciata TaxID=100452 RepID=A0A8S3Z7F8_9EUPU|nr:unnamed protein product [Candidula unifasciata]
MLECAVNKNMSNYAELQHSSTPLQTLDESDIKVSQALLLKPAENVQSEVKQKPYRLLRIQEKRHQEKLTSHNSLRDQPAAQHVSVQEEENDLEVPDETETRSPSHNSTVSQRKVASNPEESGLEKIFKGSRTLSTADLLSSLGKVSSPGLKDASNNKFKEGSVPSDKENDLLGTDTTGSFMSARSKTMPTLGRPKINPQKMSSITEGERLTKAKEMVERAIKLKKVFTIQGGYSTIRHSLRRRGWVEKFYKIPVPQKKTPQLKKQKGSDDDDNDFDDDDVDDDDDDVDIAAQADDQPKIPPWEEDDGLYGIMSRMVRNVTPSLFWVLKRDAIDYRYLTKDQMVNHYCKAGSFTTKVGLCVNMKNVVWFDNCDHDAFFPRCYRLSHDEERDAFIDDYRLTACMNIIKVAVRQHASWNHIPEDGKNKTQSCSNPDCSTLRRGSRSDKCVCTTDAEESTFKDIKNPVLTVDTTIDEDYQPVITKLAAIKKKNKQRYVIPVQVLETAIYQCEKFLASKDHEDIDVPREVGQLTDQQWDDLIKWYYQLVQEEGTFSHIPLNLAKQCESLTRRLTVHCPQFEMDGTRNVWIVKPGAKSRGRGIMCFEKLEDMLKLVCTQVVKKDGKYVVQKYIERPLLIYNTKFDIRQWFLVTDWNPLTLWFYRDSYLRFCSQQFTLEDFDQSIHLSNNAIQKHYKNGPRSSRLPEENMWTHEEFKKYLASKKHPDVWDERIYPQMKRAIVCALLVTQDLVEYRKSSFELYGADFMLTEDFRPWLIEINSSPSMESSTSVTARLCTAVLDDTIKVVVDRKFDRNCDIGRFELAYKQPLVTVPPYIGISLCVEGQALRKPSWAVRPNKESEPGRSSELPPGNDSLFTLRTVTTRSTSNNEQLPNSGKNVLNASSLLNSPVVGSAEEGGMKKNMVRIPDVMIKSLLSQPSRVTKDVASKVNTFRSPADVDRGKASSRSGSLCHNNEAVTDQKGSSGGDEAVKQVRKQQRTSEGKSSDSANSNSAAQQARDVSSSIAAQNGCSVQPAQQYPNPPCTPGTNHRRFISKSSVSTNGAIPTVTSTDRTSQSQMTAAVSAKPPDLQVCKPSSKGGSTTSGVGWHRACQWCGRGGNLHLDSADPNCRCQKDSVLVSLHVGQVNSRAQDLIILNNQQMHVCNPWQPHIKYSRKNPASGACSTPAGIEDGEETVDFKTNVYASGGLEDTTILRPASALSINMDCSNTNVSKSRPHRMRKSISVASHPPDSILKSYMQIGRQQIESIGLADQQQQQQQHRSDSFSSNKQPCAPYKSYTSQNLNNKLYNRAPANRGMLGSMLTTRVQNFLAKKTTVSTPIIKLLPSMTYISANRCQSPLSVVAQRHLPLKQHK